MSGWRPHTDPSTGLRSPISPEDYPSADLPATLIAALRSDQWETPAELNRLAGVPDFGTAAQRCFMIYGTPELEGVKVCLRLNEVMARPSSAVRHDRRTDPRKPPAEDSLQTAQVTYGFTPRDA